MRAMRVLRSRLLHVTIAGGLLYLLAARNADGSPRGLELGARCRRRVPVSAREHVVARGDGARFRYVVRRRRRGPPRRRSERSPPLVVRLASRAFALARRRRPSVVRRGP